MIRCTNLDAADILAPGFRRGCEPIQARVHKHLRGLRPNITPLIHLQTRIGRWLKEVSIGVMLNLRIRLRAVEKASCTHLTTGIIRVLSRGVCTSARFHGTDRGCCFQCGGPDDMLHYKCCPVLRRLALRWIPGVENLPGLWRRELDSAEDWFSVVSLLGPRWGRDRDLACAAILDAFLKTHTHHRLGTRVCPTSIFHARLRLLARRYKQVAKVLRGQRPPAQ